MPGRTRRSWDRAGRSIVLSPRFSDAWMAARRVHVLVSSTTFVEVQVVVPPADAARHGVVGGVVDGEGRGGAGDAPAPRSAAPSPAPAPTPRDQNETGNEPTDGLPHAQTSVCRPGLGRYTSRRHRIAPGLQHGADGRPPGPSSHLASGAGRRSTGGGTHGPVDLGPWQRPPKISRPPLPSSPSRPRRTRSCWTPSRRSPTRPAWPSGSRCAGVQAGVLRLRPLFPGRLRRRRG